MKRLAIFPTVLLFAAACTDTPTSPATDLLPQLAAVTSNTPFENTVTVAGITTCTGDPVTGTQTLKGQYRATLSTSGTHSFTYHVEVKLDLVGASGRMYTGRGVQNESIEVGPQYDDFATWRYKLVAQGEDGGADELWIVEVYRFHLTPNGDLQQDLYSYTRECR